MESTERDSYGSLSEVTEKLKGLKVELASGLLLDCQEDALRKEIEMLKDTKCIPKTERVN